MINAAFKRYDAYKDSGIEWLGDVPAHWEVKRLKDIGNSIIGITYSPEDVVEDESKGILVLRASNIQDNKLSLLDNVYVNKKVSFKQIVRKGDILLCSRSGSRSLIGKNICIDEQIEGSTFGAFMTIYRSNYFKFISKFFSSKFFESQSGLFMTSTINQLTIGTLNNLLLALPPLDEQKAIAAYLDEKTAVIDHKINLLTQKAEQYKQLKQSLINQTVTRGLDKTAPMKDSGIAWLGEIPTHWEVKRLKDVASIQYSNVDKKTHENEMPVKLSNYVDVYKNDFIDSSLPFMEATANQSEIKRFTIKKQDVLVTKDSETAEDIANPALVIEDLPGVLCGYHLAHIRTIENVLYGSFLFRLFQSGNYGFRFVVFAKGITRVGLSTSAFSDALTPIPPFAEQKAIAEYLDTKTAHIDRIVETINCQIETLRELRKTLINDVVTGKIKVID